MIENILKNNNLKVTNQRIKILNIINELGCNSTLKNIINNLNDVDTSTIYRTIKTLEDRNIIEEISGINDDVIYVISDSNKHYIICQIYPYYARILSSLSGSFIHQDCCCHCCI